MREIVMLILAAGKSERMGKNKLLLPLGEGTVISTVIDSVLSAGISRIVLITSGKIAALISKKYLSHVDFVVNASPELGQSRSMQLGVEYISAENVPFGILLGDMPLLSSNDIESILDAFSKKPSGKTAVVPESDNRFGHPCFFDPLWIRRFRLTEGDVGGRKAIRNYLDEVQLVKARKGCFIDMDTPEDYEKIQKIRADMKEGEWNNAENSYCTGRRGPGDGDTLSASPRGIPRGEP
jgi:molybdenum cofactor cytidylyltransferase